MSHVTDLEETWSRGPMLIQHTSGDFLLYDDENVAFWCTHGKPMAFDAFATSVKHVEGLPEWCAENGVTLEQTQDKFGIQSFKLIPQTDDAAFHFKMRFDVTLPKDEL